jgi:anaerobic magnesium-protoporphyrin IX monomethyl ester cyclase
MNILFVRPNKDAMGYKPIGLSLLMAVAEAEGCNVDLFDTSFIDFGFEDYERESKNLGIYKPVDMTQYGHIKRKVILEKEYVGKLMSFQPDVVAISVLGDEHHIAKEITRLTHDVYPHVNVIWGGPYASVNPMIARGYGANQVCIGEGTPFLFPWRTPAIITGRVEDLDTLPHLNWDHYDDAQFWRPYNGKAYRFGDHMLNWGCPFECTYCINKFYHKLYGTRKMRRYSVQRIINELEYLIDRHHIEMWKFHDEEFLIRPDLEELSHAYQDQVAQPFVIEAHAKSVTKEKAKMLKEMGCVSVSMGIETGNERLRTDILRRVETQEDIIRGFGILQDAGIRTVAFNMLALPFETRQTYQETVRLNRQAGVDVSYADFFYPFEGTELRDIAIKAGYFDHRTADVYRRDVPALKFKDISDQEWVDMRNNFQEEVKKCCL